jgi:DNA-binding SARP family transcriptional activator/tetratricopeptide (TPR) repeat protein
VNLLGPVRVDQAEGFEVALDSAKDRSLLAALALRPGSVVAVDALVDAIWGESAPPSARKTLQTYVSNLRRALGPGAIVTHPSGYSLKLGPEDTDVGCFRTLVREGEQALKAGHAVLAGEALAAAVALGRGRPLQGIAPHSGLAAEAVRLDEEFLSALETRIEADLATGSGAELVGELGILVHEHPFRERLWAFLLVALYRSGRQAEALATYQQVRRLLRDELGLEPGGELQRLERAILKHDPSLLAPASADANSQHPEVPRSPVRFTTANGGDSEIISLSEMSLDLLERSLELVVLAESLAAVYDSSQGRVVLVGGEAGVGKTQLLQRFRREHGGSVRILWGACDPLFAPRPLGPLMAIAEEVGGELEVVIQRDSRPHEVAAVLARELAMSAPSVFVLEDLHWADEATLDVLRLLVRRIEPIPTLVVASYRDDELERNHPLRAVLGELVTTSNVRRLRLAPLSRAGVAQLAESHDVDADELYEQTSGNPFFVTEVLLANGEEIPATVKDAVLARYARRSDNAKKVLDAVAVAPPHTELWLLEEMVGEAVQGLDECLASGMLDSKREGVAFRHELARLAVEGSIGLIGTVALHRSALAALTAAPSGNLDLARLAHHAEAAGDADAVISFALPAAERAASLGAHREAAAQFARVLRFGDRLALTERAGLFERRSRECYLTDQSDEAIEAIEKAIDCRRALGDRLKEGDDLRWLSEVLWCPGRCLESERAAWEAVALLEDLEPGRELASAYCKLATTYEGAARFDESIEWANRALELGERLGDSEVAIVALATIGKCQAPDTGIETLEVCLERARRAGLPDLVGLLLESLAMIAVETHHHAAAKRYIDEGTAYCSDRGLELYRYYLLAYRARLELETGQWDQAIASASSVLRTPRTSTTPRIIALVVLGLVWARRGDPGQWSALDEAWDLARPTGELPRLAPVAAARAEAAWLEGNPDVVASATTTVLALAIERRSTWRAGELALWRSRAGIDAGLSPETAAGPYALALAGDWAGAARLWSDMGCVYEAALAEANVDSDDALYHALEVLQRLDARPASAVVARRLRERKANTAVR